MYLLFHVTIYWKPTRWQSLLPKTRRLEADTTWSGCDVKRSDGSYHCVLVFVLTTPGCACSWLWSRPIPGRPRGAYGALGIKPSSAVCKARKGRVCGTWDLTRKVIWKLHHWNICYLFVFWATARVVLTVHSWGRLGMGTGGDAAGERLHAGTIFLVKYTCILDSFTSNHSKKISDYYYFCFMFWFWGHVLEGDSWLMCREPTSGLPHVRRACPPALWGISLTSVNTGFIFLGGD